MKPLNESDAEYEARIKRESTEHLALLLFSISHARQTPLQPHEAFQRADAFVAEALKRDPKSRLSSIR